MSFGRSEVDESPFAEDIDLASIFGCILIHKRAHEVRLACAHLLQRGYIDLHIKVTGVGYDRAVFHNFKMLSIDHVDIASDRAENITDLHGFHH